MTMTDQQKHSPMAGVANGVAKLRQSVLLLLLFRPLASSIVEAFVPPRPGTELAATYEPVHLYRQRRNITYNYEPKFLNPEMCRYLTEEECQRGDETMIEHGKRHQAIQKDLYRRKQRHLAASSTPNGSARANQTKTNLRSNSDNVKDFQEQLGAFTRTYLTGNPPTREEEREELEQLLREFNTTRDRARRELQTDRADYVHNPSVGSFVVPLFLMQFTDHADRKLPPMYEYQVLWNLRIRKWIDENSYGKYDAFFDVQDWTMTDNTEEHYSFGQSGRVVDLQGAFIPLLNAMDERLGGDWSAYDSDGDGYLDNCIILHSGYAAEESGEDCTNGRSFEYRIWSHAFPDAGTWASGTGSIKLRGYMISSALNLVCDSNPATMGVMTHEYMHTFFLIDLYDTQFIGKGLGGYDIMAYPYGVANTGYIPMNFSPWSKQTIEWQTCTPITSSGEYTLEPVAVAESCYKVTLLDTTAWEEYILLENRQQINFDVDFWAPGLLMYHIDEGAQDQQYAGYPGLDEYWPETGDHYRVALIQADGKYDLEMNINRGDPGDAWQPGMTLGPNGGELTGTFPNTDSYQQGYIEATGITIEVLESEGLNVKFRVTFGERSASFGAPRKEENPHLINHQQEQSTTTTIVQDLFNVDDEPEQHISGMLPQFPWYQEWKIQEEQEAVLAEQGRERPLAEQGADRAEQGNEVPTSASDHDLDDKQQPEQDEISAATSNIGSMTMLCCTMTVILVNALHFL